jgi:hypothetical protein
LDGQQVTSLAITKKNMNAVNLAKNVTAGDTGVHQIPLSAFGVPADAVESVYVYNLVYSDGLILAEQPALREGILSYKLLETAPVGSSVNIILKSLPDHMIYNEAEFSVTVTVEEMGYTAAVVGAPAKVTLGSEIALSDAFKLVITYDNGAKTEEKVTAAMLSGYDKNAVGAESIGDKTVTVSEYTLSGDRYVFAFCGIVPQRMDDNVYATLYGTRNGVSYVSDTVTYSISTYCYNMLNNSTVKSNVKLRRLLVDLLNYGAAAQKYTKYNTNKLVNAGLTETQKSWATGELRQLNDVLNTAYKTIANPTVTWKGAGLRMDDSVAIRVKLAAESIDGLTIKVTGAKIQTITITSDEFVETTGGYYAYVTGLHAAQMSETLYLTVYDGNTPVSNTLRYSIESYAYKNHTSTTNNLGELLTALMKYGDSARAYAG